MEDKYVHSRTCVYDLHYHIIWCTKYRRKVLTPEIADRLYSILQNIGIEKGFEVIQAKTGEMDHVHCFVSIPPKHSVTNVVR